MCASTPIPSALDRQTDAARILVSSCLSQVGFPHGFSTRLGGVSTAYLPHSSSTPAGDLNLGFTASDPAENVAENRRRLLAAVFDEQRPLVTLRQVHSAQLHRVGPQHASPQATLQGDGLMTDAPGLALGIQTADCVPVLLADPVHHAVAVFHAGWRGTLHRVVEQGVAQMQREFYSDPRQLLASIGPAIGACCYQVGEEVVQSFHAEFSYAAQLLQAPTPQRTWRLNLQAANHEQLLSAGLLPGAIDTISLCTSCRPDLFFSYRAQRGFTGRMLSVIAPPL